MKRLNEILYSEGNNNLESEGLIFFEQDFNELELKYFGNLGSFKIYFSNYAGVYYIMKGKKMLAFYELSEYYKYPQLNTIFIKPEFRNKGLGFQIYTFLIKKYKYLLSDGTQNQYSKHMWEKLMKFFPLYSYNMENDKAKKIKNKKDFENVYKQNSNTVLLATYKKLLSEMKLSNKILQILKEEEDSNNLFKPRRIETRIAAEKARIEKEILLRQKEIETRLAHNKQAIGDSTFLTEEEKEIIAKVMSRSENADWFTYNLKEFLNQLFYIKEISKSNWENVLKILNENIFTNEDIYSIRKIYELTKKGYIKNNKPTQPKKEKITKLKGNKNLVPSEITIGKYKISRPYTIKGVQAVEDRISSTSWWNVEQIQKILELKWIDGFIYYVDQTTNWDKKHNKIKIGSGFVLKGIDNKGNEYMYDRHTTASPAAGQTYLKSKFKTMKVTEALNSLKKEIEQKLEYR